MVDRLYVNPIATENLSNGSVEQSQLARLSAGAGVVPVGGIISVMPHLAGAYTTAATTAADRDGWVLCNGQTINDPESPLDTLTVPNLNNNRFIRGNAVSGTTGGADSVTLAVANLPSHCHSIAHIHCISHGHADSFSICAASQNHTHCLCNHCHSAGDYQAAVGYIGGGGGCLLIGACRACNTQVGEGGGCNGIGGTSGGSDFVADSYHQILGDDCFSTSREDPGVRVYNRSGPVTCSAHRNTCTPSTLTTTVNGSVTASSDCSGGSLTPNSGSTGSGTSFSNVPGYITGVYLMRIK